MCVGGGAKSDLMVMNVEAMTTFRRPGYKKAILGITSATADLAGRITDWAVIEDYNSSDKQ